MTHFAIVAPPLRGHLDPLLALASELVARGHRASVLARPDAARHAARMGVDFVPVGQDTHPLGTMDASLARLARGGGPLSVRAMVREVARDTDMLCRHLPTALERIGADVLIADQAEAAGGLVAQALKLPCVTTATALPLNREPGVPPPWLGWEWQDDPRARRRYAGAWRISDWLMAPMSAVVSMHAKRWGLPARRADDTFSERLQLAQAVPGLDHPRRALPPTFHYVGPMRERQTDARAWDDPRPQDTRPLVFCSLGTLQGARGGLFLRVAQACADLDLRLVIAHGGLLDAATAARLPGGPLVRDFVPQRALLRHASLVVTHAGFNTVMDALSFGVPMVAVPLAFEQPGTAARLARARAARVVSPRLASRRRLREAIGHVLASGDYRIGARALADEVARAGGAARAADLIESMTRGPRVPAPHAPAPARRPLSADATMAPLDADGARGDDRSGSS